MLPAAVLVSAYLLGSIPFSYFVARAAGGHDLRQVGSRNVGATNVARTAGRGAGAAALLLDLLKGYAAVAIAQMIVASPAWPLTGTDASPMNSREMWVTLAGMVAVLAHMFPVWLGFHGGKGVATAAGVIVALDLRVFVGVAIVFAITALASRMVSLASIMSAAAAPLLFRFLVDAPFWRVVISIVIGIAVIAKHRSNIERMAGGKERRIGDKREDR